ncbi:hypothetical protein COO60DRAFT_1554667 [Scenedesmus sp. NREL 46B-D3]|nr:hypothetical protein COO60DRAFT_1554667 [Scenedesmus sp. NREL 46B-D3]
MRAGLSRQPASAAAAAAAIARNDAAKALRDVAKAIKHTADPWRLLQAAYGSMKLVALYQLPVQAAAAAGAAAAALRAAGDAEAAAAYGTIASLMQADAEAAWYNVAQGRRIHCMALSAIALGPKLAELRELYGPEPAAACAEASCGIWADAKLYLKQPLLTAALANAKALVGSLTCLTLGVRPCEVVRIQEDRFLRLPMNSGRQSSVSVCDAALAGVLRPFVAEKTCGFFPTIYCAKSKKKEVAFEEILLDMMGEHCSGYCLANVFARAYLFITYLGGYGVSLAYNQCSAERVLRAATRSVRELPVLMGHVDVSGLSFASSAESVGQSAASAAGAAAAVDAVLRPAPRKGRPAAALSLQALSAAAAAATASAAALRAAGALTPPSTACALLQAGKAAIGEVLTCLEGLSDFFSKKHRSGTDATPLRMEDPQVLEAVASRGYSRSGMQAT